MTSELRGAKSPSSERPQTEDETFFKDNDEETAFLEWFWKKSHGNDLVTKLNAYAQGKQKEDRIRREKESPVVYCVVLNDADFPFKDEKGKQWKLCKVGFTHRPIKRGQGNRMEVVENKIVTKYNNHNEKEAEASTLFALRIGAVDITPFHDTEKRIREKIGKPVRKEKAKELGLPLSTEWVLTTQEYIDNITAMKDKKMKDVNESGKGDVIDIFKGMKDPPVPPTKHQGSWFD